MTRKEILNEAENCVYGRRKQDYGDLKYNFNVISKLWSAYLDKEVSPVDVTMMMTLLKVARIKSGGGTDDSFVDIAGYAACGGEIFERGEIFGSGNEIISQEDYYSNDI